MVTLSDNVLVPQHFGSLLYVRRSHEYVPYDHLTTDVLRGTIRASIRDLPGGLARRVPVDRLRKFHRQGRKLGYLDRRGRLLGVEIEADPPEGRLLGPLTLHLGVTQECNLRCRHCFAAPEMGQADRRILDVDTLDALFDECVRIGCMRIALTGGEPLLRPDLFAIIDRIAKRGIDTCLTTNALPIDAKVARELRRRPFAWINVSLDGATRESNDAVRGPGTFDRVVRTVRRHLKWRLPFGLSVTLHRRNLHEIGLLPRLARRLGARTVLLKAVYPVGRAAESPDLAISFPEYLAALDEIRRVVRSVRVVPTSCEDAGDESLAVVFENFGCAAGNTVATVLTNGDVSPCSLIGEGVELDNLREKSLGEIWNRGAGFAGIRGLTIPEPCRDCEDYVSCSGGCRARAFAATGAIDAPDPWCAHLSQARLRRFAV
jgi:radical SAM protein with 4Fe4S-binding SPASM domain